MIHDRAVSYYHFKDLVGRTRGYKHTADQLIRLLLVCPTHLRVFDVLHQPVFALCLLTASSRTGRTQVDGAVITALPHD